MAVTRYFTQPLAITNPAGVEVDDEGNPTTTSTTVTVMGNVQPYAAAAAEGEQTLGVEEATRMRKAWVPPTTPVSHRSTVAWRGDTYEVVGAPKVWVVGSTNDHIEFLMRLVIR